MSFDLAFASEINSLAVRTEIESEDILRVTDAILRGADVELKEERYALKLFHSKDGQDLFASTSYTVDMVELTDPERTISVSKRKEYKSDDEWREMFMAMPWFDFNAFVKVYEDV